MSTLDFKFNDNQFNKLFPYYILIDESLNVKSIGKSLEKISHFTIGKSINNFCISKRPFADNINVAFMQNLLMGMIVLELKNNAEKLNLRGQIEYLEETKEYLFVGTPWFGSMDQVRQFNLTLTDFAIHDPMIDLLHVLKTQEIGTEDLKQLLNKINIQKKELKDANKEIHDIALFPMQNPDPLIRIDLKGNILRNNPPADKLVDFEYKNKKYKAKEFWQLIATEIDKTQERWYFEVNIKEQVFSFVCKYLEKEGYFNIYGRNITEQKKIEKEFQHLSLVASANENGIVFTNKEGKITWVNEGVKKLTGYTFEECIGKTPIELFAGELSDKNEIKEMVHLFQNRKSFSIETIHYRKDGSWFWCRSKGQPVAQKDNIEEQYFTMMEDITQEKANEEQMRVLSSIAAENTNGVVIADKNGRIEWANKSFQNISGYTLEELIGNKPGSLLQGKDTNKDSIAYMRKQIKNGEPFNCDILNYKKTGESYWLRIQGQALKDSNGNIIKYFAIEQDVTQEIANQKKIQEFEKRFRIALERIGDNVWEFDFRTNKTTFSKSKNEFIGIKTTDLTDNNKLWWDNVYSDDKDLLIENDEKYKKGLIDHHVLEYRMMHSNGTIKWVLDRGVVIEKNIDGKPLKIVGTHTDITKIKETEKALRASETEFRSLAENIPGVLYKYAYYKDGSEKFIYLSPNTEEKIGIPEAFLQNFYAILSPLDYERERAISYESTVNKSPYHFVGRFNVPGKPEIWLNISSSYSQTTAEGDIIHTGIIFNVTNEKEAQKTIRNNEEKYRGIITNMNLGLIEVDLEENIQFVNHSFCEMSGYTEAELIGKKASNLFVRDEYKEMISEKNKKREIGISDAYEIYTKNKKGEPRWWMISGAPRYDENGKLIGTLGIHLDITGRKKMENQLRKSQLIAEESVKAKEVFFANMSHEIRTPLNAIIGMGNQLARTNLNDKQGFYLNTIHTAADNLLVIINDILDLSKIEAGKLSLEKIGFEPKDVVARAMMVLNHKSEEKGLYLTNSKCDEKLHSVLIGDPYRLNQILLNLLGNAIKFTEVGGVDLSCSVLEDNKNYQRIKITIKDTGIGMDEEFVQKLFEKFSQEYESVTRRFGGTGLGMSISKELIELMGGDINVKSKKGVGTSISFTIEFAKGDIKDLPVKNEFKSDVSILKNKKILVADDNEMNRLVAKTVVENFGATTIEAVNGAEVLNLLQENNNNIDLILMDVQMPILNGLDATRKIRTELNNAIPIIALTANAIKGESSKCINAGMNDYVAKPFKEEELIGIISKWLTKQNALEEKVNEDVLEEVETLYDLSKLNEIGRGNESFIKSMIKIFVEQTPVIVEDMMKAYDANDLKTMGALAHKVKPSIDSMGITSLKETIREIELLGKEQINKNNIPTLLKKTEKILLMIIEHLKTKL